MINLKSKKVLLPAIAAIAALAIVAGTLSPIAAITEAAKFREMPQITGSVNVHETMKNYIKENKVVSFSDAATTAESQVANGSAMGGHVGLVQGYLVYTFFVVDTENETGYKVIVDAGDGKVLDKSDGISMKDMGKFGPGKFGHGMGGPGFGHGPFGHFGKMMHQGWSEETDSETPQSQ
jgi:hypothetical protein